MADAAASVEPPRDIAALDMPAFDLKDVATRVRAGANPATGPDLLLALAGDPAVTVRAAVAMNVAAPPQVDRLLIEDGDERVRTLLARRLAGLIPNVSAPQRDRLREQAMGTLSVLVEDTAARVRAAIADVVKEMPEASRELILQLARDSEVSVCEPVIRLSPLLSVEDLLGLLDSSTSPVTAIAVARRPGLPESVSDAIATTAGTEAIQALLMNDTAAIREATLDALIARAAGVAAWHKPLVRRPLLSARAAWALSEIVATQLLDELSRRGDLDPALTRELRHSLAERLRREAPAADPGIDIEQAMDEARHLRNAKKLDEDSLLGVVQRGEARMATAILAVAADVPASVVERAATLRSAKGLVSLVWRSGFSMRVSGPLQTLLARLSPDAILGATTSGGFPLAVDEMRWQIDFLSRMGR